MAWDSNPGRGEGEGEDIARGRGLESGDMKPWQKKTLEKWRLAEDCVNRETSLCHKKVLGGSVGCNCLHVFILQ